MHGRRFAAYKKRKDAGKKHKPKVGTMKSVVVGQRAAVDNILRRAKQATPGSEAADPMTLVGVRRRALKRAAKRMESGAPSKATLDFRKTTVDRRKYKKKGSDSIRRHWPGYGRDRVVRERRTGPVDDRMVAKPTAHNLVVDSVTGRWKRRPAASHGAGTECGNTSRLVAGKTEVQ